MHKILLLDDHFEVLLAMRTLVASLGYAVRSAAEAREALRMLKRESVDLVITDLKMPGMDGVEFVKVAREQGYTGKIIVVTGFPEMTAMVNAQGMQVDGVLLKPVQMQKLKTELARLLAPTAADPKVEEKPL